MAARILRTIVSSSGTDHAADPMPVTMHPNSAPLLAGRIRTLCGMHLAADEEHESKRVRCPYCTVRVREHADWQWPTNNVVSIK